ncbi:MAG TPA: leucyl/phenylalanyl-tRNA--protein transferase [Candidatus Rifleibacterium sp.]|jgi:leucyl/phenylalanyl-tRNA--protein transferase|nr:leucyl/phenylalanyl-tRNA--protein transferase [Candidatus Rifleibacterium sp.]
MYEVVFPEPENADDDGLLAVGGDLRPETMLKAYRSGIFPWTVKPISWWSPDPRAIFEIASFRLSTRMQRLFRSGRFSFSLDRCFTRVMEGCAAPAPGRESTWISPEFISAYTRLHKMGYAHCAEVWLGEQLVGGIYGVSIGGFFAGESMFHTVSNASTMALAFLMEHLKKQGFELFDSQVISSHTASLGAIEIRRKDYLRRLSKAIGKSCSF